MRLRNIKAVNRWHPTSGHPGLSPLSSLTSLSLFISTTVTTGATNVVQALASTAGLEPGMSIRFATAAVDRTILTVDSSTQVTLTASVTSTTSEVVTIASGSPTCAIFRRAVMPVDGFIKGLSFEWNALLTGSGGTMDFNLGVFSVDETDTNIKPVDLIPGLEGTTQATSAGMVGYTTRHWQSPIYFSAPKWIRAGTPLVLGGLYRTTGTISTGKLNGILQNYPPAALGAGTYRASFKSTSARAYSSGTLAGLIAAIGAFPTGFTAVNATTDSQAFLACLHMALIIDETF